MKVDQHERTSDSPGRRSGPLAIVTARMAGLTRRYPSASQSLLSIFDQALVSGTSFLTAAIIGRMTAPDELGRYYLVLSIIIIGSAIQDAAVSSPYLVYCKRRQGRELAEYSGSVWVHHLVLALLMIGVMAGMIVLAAVSGHERVLPGLWALLAVGPFILFRQGARRFAYANLQVKSVIVLDALVAIVQLGGLVLLGYFDRMTLPAVFALMGGACGLALLGSYLFARPPLHFVRSRFRSDWRRNWAFSKWALRSYLVGNTTPYVMLWILGVTVGVAAAGIYGACNTLIGMTNVLLTGVDNVLTPQAAHAYATGAVRGLRRILYRTAAVLIAGLGSFCLVVLFTGDWLAVLAFGPDYDHTGGVLLALAGSALMNSIGIVAGNGLWAVDQPRKNFLGDVACMVATLVVGILLIPPTGALGAAVATLAGMTAAAVVRTMLLVHYLRQVSVEETVPDPNADVRPSTHEDNRPDAALNGAPSAATST